MSNRKGRERSGAVGKSRKERQAAERKHAQAKANERSFKRRFSERREELAAANATTETSGAAEAFEVHEFEIPQLDDASMVEVSEGSLSSDSGLTTMTATPTVSTLRSIFDPSATISAAAFLDACRGAGIDVQTVPDGHYRPVPTSSGASLRVLVPGTYSNITAMGGAVTIVVDDPRRPFLGTVLRGAQMLVFPHAKDEAEAPTFPPREAGFTIKLQVQTGAALTFMPEGYFPGTVSVSGASRQISKKALRGGRRSARKSAEVGGGEGGVATKKITRTHRVRWIRPTAFAQVDLRVASIKPDGLILSPGAFVHYRDPAHAAEIAPLTKGILHPGTQGIVDPFGIAFVLGGAYALAHPTSIIFAEETAEVEVREDAPIPDVTMNIPKCGGLHRVEWARAVETQPGTRRKQTRPAGTHQVVKVLVDGQSAPEGLVRSQRCIDPHQVGLVFRMVLAPPASKARHDAAAPPRNGADTTKDPNAATTHPPRAEDETAIDPSAATATPPGAKDETAADAVTPTPTTKTPTLPAGLPDLPRGGLPSRPVNGVDLPSTGGGSLTLMVAGGAAFVLVGTEWKRVPWRVKISVDPSDAARSLLTGGEALVPAVVTFVRGDES